MSDFSILKQQDYLVGHFNAMASPCDLLIDTQNNELAHELTRVARIEALRIEKKFSRYRNDNIIHAINNSNGQAVTVDEETANLFDYAQQCYQISNGLFDITSGVLRTIWTFDGSDNIATQEQINRQLSLVGWGKVKWERPVITLVPGMEIDFGGVGKEYAVDQTVQLIENNFNTSCLVNYGGDIRVTGLRSNGQAWGIGIEDPQNLDTAQSAAANIQLSKGAIATSGDTRKFLFKDGVRYSHVLHPKTGWPVTRAPRTITVVANTCTEAGILATLALLHEEKAEEFLRSENIKYWCNW